MSLPSCTAGSAASITSTTSGEFGTHRIVTSLASTTPRGPSPSFAPKPTAASIGPRLRDATVTSCPASTRCRAIGKPMAPRPMNPTRMAFDGTSRPPYRERPMASDGGTASDARADVRSDDASSEPLLSFAVPDDLLREAVAASNAEVGAAVFAASAAQIGIGLPVALASDRGSRVKVAALCLFIFGVAVPLQGLVESIWLFAFLGIISAFGKAPNQTTHLSYLADWYPPEARARVAAYQRGHEPVARTLGVAIMGGVAAAAGSWRWATLLALFAFPVGMLVLRLREPAKGKHESSHILQASGLDFDDRPEGTPKILRVRRAATAPHPQSLLPADGGRGARFRRSRHPAVRIAVPRPRMGPRHRRAHERVHDHRSVGVPHHPGCRLRRRPDVPTPAGVGPLSRRRVPRRLRRAVRRVAVCAGALDGGAWMVPRRMRARAARDGDLPDRDRHRAGRDAHARTRVVRRVRPRHRRLRRRRGTRRDQRRRRLSRRPARRAHDAWSGVRARRTAARPRCTLGPRRDGGGGRAGAARGEGGGGPGRGWGGG